MQTDFIAGEKLKGRIGELIHQLSTALNLCDPEQYAMPLPILSGASIGEHTRHIIEFFQCLNTGIASGKVDYAKRERNRKLETGKEYAIEVFRHIHNQLPVQESQCILQNEAKNDLPTMTVATGYYRELVYTIEHAVHHMAILKIGLKSLQLDVDHNFGVAPSTIEYRSACAS